MQLLRIKENTTLAELSDMVGDRNVESLLAANKLSRTPAIGRAFKTACNKIEATVSNVSASRKSVLLNSLITESDIFEAAALQDDSNWKITSELGTLSGMLKVPDSFELPDSTSVMGNHQSVGNIIYKKVIDCLNRTGTVDPAIFNEYRNVKDAQLASLSNTVSVDPFQWFKLPWGQVSLYSSIDKQSMDFPVYPEELSDGRSANYTQMPDMLYQYEPWQIYQSSGPRAVTYSFTFHRDMWTGDHTDGKANQLIRFCEACCYPEYNGSAVNTPTVTLYIAGKPHITGVMTAVTPRWSGPLGHDGWYLVCQLEITITEVSPTALNYSVMKQKGLIN